MNLFTASLGAFPFVFSSRPTYDTPTLRHHRRRRRCQTGRRLVQEGARLKLDPFHSFFFSTLVSRCVRASLVLCFYSIALCGVCVVCVVLFGAGVGARGSAHLWFGASSGPMVGLVFALRRIIPILAFHVW